MRARAGVDSGYGVQDRGRHAFTIRAGHHRELLDLQDAGRTYFLRSSSRRACNRSKTSSMQRPTPRELCCLLKANRRVGYSSCARDE